MIQLTNKGLGGTVGYPERHHALLGITLNFEKKIDSFPIDEIEMFLNE